MWRPGFDAVESAPARVTGLHRSFCVYSFHHRGTAARPGLVLGLDRGGTCDGVAYKAHGAKARDILAYLREREQVSGVYREAIWSARLNDGSGRSVKALTYIVERAHPQYAPPLPLLTQARIICGAKGISGVNLDYLLSTVAHLRELGILERDLERICALSGPHLSQGQGPLAGGQRDGSLFAARTKAMTGIRGRMPLPVGPMKMARNNFRFRHCLHAIG